MIAKNKKQSKGEYAKFIDSKSLIWFVWRPITEGLTTLREIDEHYTLVDLFDANAAVDVMMKRDELRNRTE